MSDENVQEGMYRPGLDVADCCLTLEEAQGAIRRLNDTYSGLRGRLDTAHAQIEQLTQDRDSAYGQGIADANSGILDDFNTCKAELDHYEAIARDRLAAMGRARAELAEGLQGFAPLRDPLGFLIDGRHARFGFWGVVENQSGHVIGKPEFAHD